MTDNCATCADDLLTALSDQNYPQDILDASSKLSEMIAEHDKENPENVPSVRVAKDNYPDKEQEAEVKDTEEEDKAEEVDPKEMRDMPLSEHKAMLKKKKIIIQID